MLTVGRCEKMALHTLGYTEALPAEFSALEIINRTGRWLCSAHPWNWLVRLDTVDVTSGELFVPLTSLGAVTGVIDAQFTDTASNVLEESNLSVVFDRRTRSIPGGGPYYWALNERIAADGALTKVLELDSALTATVTDGMTVYFRAGWQVPENGSADARIAIPDEWEGIFILGVRAVARGYQEEDTASVDARLNLLRRSDEFMDLKRMDGMRQSHKGHMGGGGVAQEMAGPSHLRYPSAPTHD